MSAHIQYVMKGNLPTQPYERVTWSVFDTPDMTGAFSGYGANFLINIAIDYTITPRSNGPAAQPIYYVPTGQVGGDLDGYLPDPTVSGIQGIPVSNIAPQDGYVLTFNGSEYIPSAAVSGFSAGGDLSGTSTSQEVIGIISVPINLDAELSDGDVLIYSADANQWFPEQPSSFTPGGDLAGNSTNQTVIGIQGNLVSSGVPGQVNQIYYWNGSSFSLDTMDYTYYVPYQLIAGVFTTTSSSPVMMGQITIDPRTIKAPVNYSLSAPYLYVDFATSSGTATAQLYNATDSVNVGGTLTTSSSTISEKNRQLPLGTSSGDIISNASKSYQLLISTTSGTVTITNARIVFSGNFSVAPD